MSTFEQPEDTHTLEEDRPLSAYYYKGPTLIVAMGTEMTSEDYAERLALRAQEASEIVYRRIINGVIENTAILVTGGPTGETKDMGSEAELMLLNMAEQIGKFTKETTIKVSLYGVDTKTLNLEELQVAQESRTGSNHWFIPIYIDNKSSSTVENFESVDPELFDYSDILIVPIAGRSRPSATRARITANRLFPDSMVEAVQTQERSEPYRVARAMRKEGLPGALKEMGLSEALLSVATKTGMAKLFGHTTRDRIKS